MKIPPASSEARSNAISVLRIFGPALIGKAMIRQRKSYHQNEPISKEPRPQVGASSKEKAKPK
jgi:hypothetical protein